MLCAAFSPGFHTGAWVLRPAYDVINNVVLILRRKHVAINNIIIEGMKLRRNRRPANYTKSAVTMGILLPRVPLHYRCLPYTLVVLFLALTLQRSAFIRNTDRPKLGFLKFFRNGTNQSLSATRTTENEPCFPHLLTYRSSKHQHITCSRRGTQSHTIHMSFTTIDVYVFA